MADAANITIRVKKLFRIRRIRPHNADLVIGERMMRSGNFNLWHMARDAVACCRFASASRQLIAVMTGKAFSVVAGIYSVDFLVRVVTGRAADTFVIRVVALAVSQAIRLKSHTQDTEAARGCHLFPRAMALPAKVRRLLAI